MKGIKKLLTLLCALAPLAACQDDLYTGTTGGPTEESMRETIAAGADAITWTPPSNGEVFRDVMEAYRQNKAHP